EELEEKPVERARARSDERDAPMPKAEVAEAEGESDEKESAAEEDEDVGESKAIVKADAGDSIEGAGSEDEVPDDALAARTGEEVEKEEGEEEQEEVAAGQLGTDRYVLAGFFAGGMILAYVLGRAIAAIWQTIANKDWFSTTFPRLAAVGDDDRSMYSLLLG